MVKTLKESDLVGLTQEITELGIDSMLDDGVLKDIPIIGAIVGTGKLAITIKDRLFLKKLVRFLLELKRTGIEERNDLISKIEASNKYKIKVGEQLMYYIDRCDDHLDAAYIAQLFCAFIKEKVSYDEFLKGSQIIQNIFNGDLEYFLNADISEFERHSPQNKMLDAKISPLVNAGICIISYESISVKENRQDVDMLGKFKVQGGEARFSITPIGFKLKDSLTHAY